MLLTSGIILFKMKKKVNTPTDTLRVAFPYKKKANEYDPTKIQLAPDYIFLENIFSTLIELSKDKGAPISSIAKSFSWIGNELHFEIRDDLYTISGYKITAEDVEFSLKRLLILSKNTHGNLKDLICPQGPLKTISESCRGIAIEGNKIILKPNVKTPFLLKMLASIDFAILPIPSVDPKTLEIKDYKNTSGPYYVEADDENGNILLVANKNHFHFNESIPQKIQLVPSGMSEVPNSLAQFKANKVDFITTIDRASFEDVIQFSKANSQSKLHQTLDIKTYVAVYTEKGIRRFSTEKRLGIGKKLKRIFLEDYKSVSAYKPTDQFFPAYGDGGLTKNYQALYRDIYKAIDEVKDSTGVHISILGGGSLKGFVPTIKKALFKVTQDNNVPTFKTYSKESEIPDIFLVATDVGFMEDIGLITYSMNAGLFGLKKEDGQKWLKQYMEILDKEERLKKLRALHFKALSEGILVPLVSAPYVALARKPWRMELPQIYANNPLWLVKKN